MASNTRTPNNRRRSKTQKTAGANDGITKINPDDPLLAETISFELNQENLENTIKSMCQVVSAQSGTIKFMWKRLQTFELHARHTTDELTKNRANGADIATKIHNIENVLKDKADLGQVEEHMSGVKDTLSEVWSTLTNLEDEMVQTYEETDERLTACEGEIAGMLPSMEQLLQPFRDSIEERHTQTANDLQTLNSQLQALVSLLLAKVDRDELDCILAYLVDSENDYWEQLNASTRDTVEKLHAKIDVSSKVEEMLKKMKGRRSFSSDDDTGSENDSNPSTSRRRGSAAGVPGEDATRKRRTSTFQRLLSAAQGAGDMNASPRSRRGSVSSGAEKAPSPHLGPTSSPLGRIGAEGSLSLEEEPSPLNLDAIESAGSEKRGRARAREHEREKTNAIEKILDDNIRLRMESQMNQKFIEQSAEMHNKFKSMQKDMVEMVRALKQSSTNLPQLDQPADEPAFNGTNAHFKHFSPSKVLTHMSFGRHRFCTPRKSLVPSRYRTKRITPGQEAAEALELAAHWKFRAEHGKDRGRHADTTLNYQPRVVKAGLVVEKHYEAIIAEERRSRQPSPQARETPLQRQSVDKTPPIELETESNVSLPAPMERGDSIDVSSWTDRESPPRKDVHATQQPSRSYPGVTSDAEQRAVETLNNLTEEIDNLAARLSGEADSA